MKKWMLYLLAALALAGGQRSSGRIPPVLRLHVVANSDSAADQAAKLKVRDAVIQYMDGRPKGLGSFLQAWGYAAENGEEIAAVASRVLKENGMDYGASASVGVFPFPDRAYGGLPFPAGDYYALRVELGAAAGGNWWCVLFPPLCLLEQIQVEDGWKEEDGVRYRSLFGELLGIGQ